MFKINQQLHTVLIGYCDYQPVTKSPKIGGLKRRQAKPDKSVWLQESYVVNLTVFCNFMHPIWTIPVCKSC